eukprot:6940295-Prymnesium_polylepis.2
MARGVHRAGQALRPSERSAACGKRAGTIQCYAQQRALALTCSIPLLGYVARTRTSLWPMADVVAKGGIGRLR